MRKGTASCQGTQRSVLAAGCDSEAYGVRSRKLLGETRAPEMSETPPVGQKAP